LLGDRDESVKLAVIQAIVSIGGAAAVVPLLDRLSDEASEVRIAAARALGELGDRRAVLPLLGAVQDSAPEVRDAAASALGRLRDARAVRGLVGLLRDAQPEVRIAAARALGALGEQSAVVDLAPIALGVDVPGERARRSPLVRAAIVSIGRIGGDAAQSVLVRALRASQDDATANAAADALRATGDSAQSVIAALTEEPVPRAARDAVCTLLGDIGGDRAADALLNLSEVSQTTNFELGLRALGRTGSPRALRALLRAASAPAVASARQTALGSIQSAAVSAQRTEALRAIEAWVARTGTLESEALDPLLLLLREAMSAPRSVTISARAATGRNSGAASTDVAIILRLIGRSNNPRAPRALTAVLNSSDRTTRAIAAEALTRVGVEGIETLVVSLLTDSASAVRASAGEALGKFGNAAALNALLDLWSGDRPSDRAVAAVAMARIAARLRDPRVTPLLVASLSQARTELSIAIIDGLGSLASNDAAAASTLMALARANATMSLSAIEALSNALATANTTITRSIVETLQLLTREDQAEHTRSAAAWALGHATEHDTAMAALIPLLTSATNSVAANALAAMTLHVRAGGTLPSETQASLCASLSGQTWAPSRANALALIEAVGVRCDPALLGRMIVTSHTPAVRINAAAALARAARTNEHRVEADEMLTRCANNDRSVSVATRCRAERARMIAAAQAASAATNEGTETAVLDTLDVFVLTEDEDGPAIRNGYVLWLPNGLARVGVTGASGWIHERPTLRGEYTLQDPAQLAREQ
jgi:HEAT repeat protein